jgi:hypothetical protein
MALQAQAQLLDELMGKFRNVAPGDKVNSTRFDDADVSLAPRLSPFGWLLPNRPCSLLAGVQVPFVRILSARPVCKYKS